VGLKDRVDVAGGPTSVVGKCHRRTTEDIEVGHHAPASQAIAEPAEGILDGSAVEKWIFGAHATCNSWAAT
jgi:hypothetical protein